MASAASTKASSASPFDQIDFTTFLQAVDYIPWDSEDALMEMVRQDQRADGKPKRPYNVFMLFCALGQRRNRSKALLGAQSQGENSKVLGALWQQVKYTEYGAPYQRLAKVLKTVHGEENPDYVYERSQNGTRKRNSDGGRKSNGASSTRIPKKQPSTAAWKVTRPPVSRKRSAAFDEETSEEDKDDDEDYVEPKRSGAGTLYTASKRVRREEPSEGSFGFGSNTNSPDCNSPYSTQPSVLEPTANSPFLTLDNNGIALPPFTTSHLPLDFNHAAPLPTPPQETLRIEGDHQPSDFYVHSPSYPFPTATTHHLPRSSAAAFESMSPLGTTYPMLHNIPDLTHRDSTYSHSSTTASDQQQLLTPESSYTEWSHQPSSTPYSNMADLPSVLQPSPQLDQHGFLPPLSSMMTNCFPQQNYQSEFTPSQYGVPQWRTQQQQYNIQQQQYHHLGIITPSATSYPMYDHYQQQQQQQRVEYFTHNHRHLAAPHMTRDEAPWLLNSSFDDTNNTHHLSSGGGYCQQEQASSLQLALESPPSNTQWDGTDDWSGSGAISPVA